MKQELRREMLQKRAAMPEEERKEKSRKIMEILENSEAYAKAERIFSYYSMGEEVETGAFLERALAQGKTVAVPKTERGYGMFFLPIKSLADCREGFFHVPEPMGSPQQAFIPREGDLFLVPGLVFDLEGNRIGYGGGYYDRYLQSHKGFSAIGLAFSFQIREEPLPVGEKDMPLDDLITELGWMGGRKK